MPYILYNLKNIFCCNEFRHFSGENALVILTNVLHADGKSLVKTLEYTKRQLVVVVPLVSEALAARR